MRAQERGNVGKGAGAMGVFSDGTASAIAAAAAERERLYTAMKGLCPLYELAAVARHRTK